jgi:hypothetical protein
VKTSESPPVIFEIEFEFVYEKRVLSPRFCATFLFSSHFFKLCYDKNRTTNKEKTLLLFTAKNMKVIHTYSFMKKLLKKVTTPPTPYDKLQKAEQASINYDGISNPVIYDDETSEHIPAIKKIYLTNASFSQIRYEKDAKKTKNPFQNVLQTGMP